MNDTQTLFFSFQERRHELGFTQVGQIATRMLRARAIYHSVHDTLKVRSQAQLHAYVARAKFSFLLVSFVNFHARTHELAHARTQTFL